MDAQWTRPHRGGDLYGARKVLHHEGEALCGVVDSAYLVTQVLNLEREREIRTVSRPRAARIARSTGSGGDCHDDVVVESFFAPGRSN